MVQTGEPPADWRDASAYAGLLGADRALIAWEWLRRDPSYRSAAIAATSLGLEAADADATAFGLVAFEDPALSIRAARPLWSAECYSSVVTIDAGMTSPGASMLDLRAMQGLLHLHCSTSADHLLISDGRQMLRLDGPSGRLGGEPFVPVFSIIGLNKASAQLLTVRRLLSLVKTGRFAPSESRVEAHARTWALQLRTLDALTQGAGQREIAAMILDGAAADPQWRIRHPSLRSRVQRLVRTTREMAAGGWRALLG